MSEAIDYRALDWVRQELNETLKQARQFLEEYAEHPGKPESLLKCRENLHQGRGPLQMVDLQGADMLASEMEALIDALIDVRVEQPDTAMEILMQAFLQLPDYLSRLTNCSPDKPAALLPVINALRVARNVEALPESVVFSPDLAIPMPQLCFQPQTGVDTPDVQEVARTRRHHFQAGFLEWYRGEDGNSGLQKLYDVLGQLQQASRMEPCARLWWFSAGLTEALINGALQVTTGIKQLFGQIDRQIRHLTDVGESSFSSAVPGDLLRQLLFNILQAESELGRIGEIKQTYVPDQGEADIATESLAGRSEELLSKVSATASEMLEQIKEQLDIFIRNGMSNPVDLDDVVRSIHALVNTVEMIGLHDAGSRLVECEQHIQEMVDGKRSIDEAGMMHVAAAMLAVEDALNDWHTGGNALAQQEEQENFVYRQGLDAVIREVVADMVESKECINDYINSPGEFGKLNSVPGLLNQVRGGLQLSGQERAAAMVAQVGEYIVNDLIGSEHIPDKEQLDTLADAICSIEYHVEELKENRIHGCMVLDIAEQSLGKLGYTGALPECGDEPAAELPDTPAAGQTVASLPVITELQIIAADTDEEIRDVFIEEVEEELKRLASVVPVWVADSGNREILESISRSFHTLKGGGRMVGALALGEFSWVFEDLVNQVIDGGVNPDEYLCELLLQVTKPLSQLLDQIKGGPAPEADVDGIVVRAIKLAHPGKMVPDLVPEAVPEGVAVPGADEPVTDIQPFLTAGSDENVVAEKLAERTSDDLPVLAEGSDPEIVEIFLEEAAEEIAILSAKLPDWISDPGNEEALVTVRRSLHTLKGSGRMAGAMMVGEFSWAIESLLNRVIEGAIEVDGVLCSLLNQVVPSLSGLVNELNDGQPPSVDYRALMESAGKLVRGESIEPAEDAVVEVIEPAEDAAVEAAESAEDDSVETAESTPITEADEKGMDDVHEGEPALMDVFIRECREHLESIRTFIDICDGNDDACYVSESLYRALHTLSGSADSADMASIHVLAGGLYNHISTLYEKQQPVRDNVLEAMRACVVAVADIVETLPDTPSHEDRMQSLQQQIANLSLDEEQVEVPELSDEAENLFVDKPQDSPVDTINDSSEEPLPGIDPEGAVVSNKTAAATKLAEDHYADIDPDLFEVFLEEAGEIIESSEATLHAWKQAPDHRQLMEEFQRQLHTLKGGARMVGIDAIGNLSHSLETLLNRVVDGHVEISACLFDLLHEVHDKLADMLEKVRVREVPGDVEALEEQLKRAGIADENQVVAVSITEPAPEQEQEPSLDNDDRQVTVSVAEPSRQKVVPVQEELSEHINIPVRQETMPVVDIVEQLVEQAVQSEAAREGEVMPAERRNASRVRGDQVRVQAELLDNLVNHAGEINIYRSRLEQQVGSYRFNLAELDQTINRLRDQLRQFEIETETQILYRHGQEVKDRNPGFDPLEMDRYSNLQQLSRSLMESISDLHSIQELLDDTTRESETLLLQQSRVSTDLQEGLLRTRMIPFAGLASRLRRIVRQAAHELDKKVDLKLDGAEGEMDRTVIERIIAPLEHMLRNSVDHGIEKPEQRRNAGKPETGTIKISFHREGPEIVLRIIDDGKGINVDAIRDRAYERGLIADKAELSDSEVMQFILQAGFSTASKVTQISGRGVGMDVVISEVKQLGGSLHIGSKPGVGSIFTIRLPYTLAINQVLLVKAGEDTFCIPLGSIEGVARVAPDVLSECYETSGAVYQYAGHSYQLQHLGTLLNRGGMNLEDVRGRIPVLLVRLGEKRIALQVESLLGHREIVVKPLGAQLSTVNGVSGATILGNGRVVLILDLAAVVRTGNKMQVPEAKTHDDHSMKLVVMVVDDSITVRKVTTRLLERHGFQVITARDGIDALGLLQEAIPDMMLLDVEMPRMDGFELATHMRNDEQFRHIPITMITSRTGDKHRARADQIGIDHYLGKPYQEHELLNTIQHVIGIPGAYDQN
jgi:chemosensory pili system protein ChpA (sensor histidine kinase/response regulator)